MAPCYISKKVHASSPKKKDKVADVECAYDGEVVDDDDVPFLPVMLVGVSWHAG